MNTDEALKLLFTTKKGYLLYGIPMKTWFSYKDRFKNGTLGPEAKENLLISCGFEKKEDWQKKK